MPDWNVYYGSGGTTSSSSSSWTTEAYEQWKYECEQRDHALEQMQREAEEQCYQEMREARELAEDKEKYPLFFLKEGIV